MQQKELKIDPELRDLLPPLTDDEYKQLEKNIVENGFDKNFPIMEWNGFIVDGHNRYSICKKHNIEYVVGTLAYETKAEVMQWMLDIQLGRRNLSPIQRIAVAEKYRPIYEKQAKENLSIGGRNGGLVTQNKPLSNLTNPLNSVDTNKKLADIAGVKPTTYKMGSKVLNSTNEDLKQRVLSGETSISAGYKELQNEKKKTQSSDNSNREYNTEPLTTPSPIIQPSQINGTYEKNKIEQDFNNCIKALGFKLDIFGEEPGNDYKIKCPAKLLEVYKEYSLNDNIDDFIECMDLVKGCWNGNSKSLQWNYIRGMFDFYETYKGVFDNKRLITSVGKKSPSIIKEIADNDKYTKKPSLKYAKIYVNEYNSGLNKNKRLKMSLLEA